MLLLLMIICVGKLFFCSCRTIPYCLKWNKQLGDFVSLTNVSFCSDIENEFQSEETRKYETHKFDGKPITLAYYEEKNLITFYDNNTKVSGVLGEVWNILSEYLNFTLRPVKHESGIYGYKLRGKQNKYIGMLGVIQNKEADVIPRVNFYLETWNIMDYTVPIWKNKFQMYIRPQIKTNDSWIFKMFTVEVWLIIVLFTVAFSLLYCWMDKINIHHEEQMKKSHHKFMDYMFYTFATLCSQGWLPKDIDGRFKILEISKRFFAWFLLITLSSHLVSYMTNVKIEPPFKDIVSLLNETKYTLVVFNGSMSYARFKSHADRYSKIYSASRFEYMPTKEAMYENACNGNGKKKYALLESEDRQQASGMTACQLVRTGAPVFTTWVTTGVAKGFKYKRAFDTGILKMQEVGLLDSLKDRWWRTKSEPLAESIAESINFTHIYMLFVILILGVIIAIIICIIENIIFFNKFDREHKKKSVLRIHPNWTHHPLPIKWQYPASRF